MHSTGADVDPSSDLTTLLNAWQAGDRAALERVVPELYEELKRLARRAMRGERGGHTLQATALVNEAYLKLADAGIEIANRTHFLALSARMMRRILVDHARARGRAKRGGGQTALVLEESLVADARPEADLLEFDDALNRLAQLDERPARVVELIYFGGLSYEEAAEALGVSRTTLVKDLRFAKAWLAKELG
jgi:RNA polymerase sigma factor (TIGR02999 family)